MTMVPPDGRAAALASGDGIRRIFGRIGRGPAPRDIATTHRISGVLAVLLSVPVAFHCLWSLGFGTYDARVFAHSLFGYVFYGVFVTKMLAEELGAGLTIGFELSEDAELVVLDLVE